jgi:hypothetical protein
VNALVGDLVDEFDVGAQNLMPQDEVIEAPLEPGILQDAMVLQYRRLLMQREVRFDQFLQPYLFLI